MITKFRTEAFFMDASDGQRFCLFFSPEVPKLNLGAILFLHPFAEEMNKSRKMVALQARSFAELGYSVLLIDLFGCGDSAADFNDARWEIWKDDAELACRWLAQHGYESITLWGLRLGALLALDVSRATPAHIERLILWQPLIDGNQFLSQFWRLRLASDMLNATPTSDAGTLSQMIEQNQSVEIAGYLLHPQLAASIVSLDAQLFDGLPKNIHWFECMSSDAAQIAPARKKIVDAWQMRGHDVRLQLIECSAFWNSQETSINRQLIEATSSILETR